eukprot:4107301-Heterocapsa_arctica.AAC.1
MDSALVRGSIKLTYFTGRNLLKDRFSHSIRADALVSIAEANDPIHHLRVITQLQNSFVVPNDQKVPVIISHIFIHYERDQADNVK